MRSTGIDVETLSVLGLGKLGLPLAVCLGISGYRVIGIDNNPSVVQAINEGRSPVYEPGLEQLLAECEGRFEAVQDIGHAVRSSQATFIVVPTPSDDSDGFSSEFAAAAAASIGQELKSKDSFHLVVLVSTVSPGTTAGVIQPLLESSSGKQCGTDFGLCYSPEFVALGSVVHDLRNPDLLLIGESDTRSGDMLAAIYQRVCTNQVPVVRMTPTNAELAKLAINTFVTTKITFANMLAEICEHIPGGDVDAVTRAVGLDSRIGGKYLKGGLSYGGPCFPRDNKALSSFARTVGSQAKLSDITDEVNREQVERIVRLVKERLGILDGKRIAVLGLTYKPGTDITEESASLKLASALARDGATLDIYEPSGARPVLGESADEKVVYAESVEECLEGADLCILATPWEEFKKLTPQDFLGRMRRPLLLDCWRFFDRHSFGEKLEYFAIGLAAK